MNKFSFPFYQQLDAMDCGPSCLRMIAKYYGKSYSLQTLRERSFITRQGVSMLGISDAAESIGFRTSGVKVTLPKLQEDVPLPCVLHWNQNHFVVLYRIQKRRNGKSIYHIADPAHGLVNYEEKEFLRCWFSTRTEGEDEGTALALVPGPDFEDYEEEKEVTNRDLSYFFRYLTPYRRNFIQLILGMVLGSLLQLIFPFLTQALVDTGIRDANLSFITLVLISQMVLFVTQLALQFIQSWIMLHVNVRINIHLISDFLAKLMKLPIGFFDTKMIGDIIQRIGDHGRIESFLTGTSISTVFSFFNFIVFGFILAYFNLPILGVFLIGNTLYVIWILLFMRYRRQLDIKRFAQAAGDRSNIYQLITGMQEIKLNNCEKQKRWQWERIQIKLFKISIQGMALGQYQQIGSLFFSQTTNIVISFMAAKEVVSGNMTLGMMMSLTYIIGQLSGPIGQLIGFAQSLQDAKISLERLSEIHQKKDEEQSESVRIKELPERRDIRIENVFFSYDGAEREYVLDNISLVIPQNKITAIVGASGSGKTTIIKLLLGFYPPNKGSIYVGEVPLKNISPHVWRQKCGSVMQDGFIFSDTIANNIAVSDEFVDKKKLLFAAETANIREFVDSLPLGYNSKIGMEGNGISQGQKQRVFIARAVYKNPEFLFFDEATNSLDTNNEKEIMDKLSSFYQDKTVVIVAHRLSTVRHADNIVVVDKGKIAEEGTHEDLIARKGIYYTLVKNQIDQ